MESQQDHEEDIQEQIITTTFKYAFFRGKLGLVFKIHDGKVTLVRVEGDGVDEKDIEYEQLVLAEEKSQSVDYDVTRDQDDIIPDGIIEFQNTTMNEDDENGATSDEELVVEPEADRQNASSPVNHEQIDDLNDKDEETNDDIHQEYQMASVDSIDLNKSEEVVKDSPKQIQTPPANEEELTPISPSAIHSDSNQIIYHVPEVAINTIISSDKVSVSPSAFVCHALTLIIFSVSTVDECDSRSF
jgi:hypothetical protein